MQIDPLPHKRVIFRFDGGVHFGYLVSKETSLVGFTHVEYMTFGWKASAEKQLVKAKLPYKSYYYCHPIRLTIIED